MSADTRGIRERPDRPDNIGDYAIYESGDWLLPLADFLDKYDQDWEKLCTAERERCCADVCIGCADVERWGKAEFDESVAGNWVHRGNLPDSTLPCEARVIRERVRKENI